MNKVSWYFERHRLFIVPFFIFKANSNPVYSSPMNMGQISIYTWIGGYLARRSFVLWN